MTSQKFLKNNVSFNDFKRSLLEPMIFALIAFGVLFFSTTNTVIQFVTAPENKSELAEIYQMFMSGRSMFGSGSQYLLFVGMVFCGALMAYKCFYFLLSKKQVNVYLSLGVQRKTMFINRTLSSILWLFAASFLPIFITYIVNVVAFGATTLMLHTFLYFSFALFVSGLTGFALGSFAMMISGNLFDYALVLLSVGAIPICCYNTIDYLKFFWLKGCYQSMHTSPYKEVFTPLTFVTSVNPDMDHTDLLDTVLKNPLNFEVATELAVTKAIIFPLIVWLAVSVVLLALAFLLIKLRKAEHANSFGNSPLARGIISVFAFVMISMIVVQSFAHDARITLPIVALIIIGFSIVAFFIIQIVMTRKIKMFIKSLPVLAGFAVVLALVFTVIGTGIFGTYNKVPELEEVESVSIDLRKGTVMDNYIQDGIDFIESKNPKDIEMVLSLFDQMQSAKTEDYYIESISFMIKYKDGKAKLRTFNVSKELYDKYIETTINSDFFDALLEATFIGFNDKGVSKNGYYSFEKVEDIINGESQYVGGSEGFDYFDESIFNADYYDAQGIIYNSVVDEEQEPEYTINLMRGDEIAIALYNDLSKMTFEQIYQNTEKPVGNFGYYIFNVTAKTDTVVSPRSFVSYYSDDKTQKDDPVLITDSYINVYKEMTETLKALNDNGITYKDQYEGKVKEILYTDSPLSAPEIMKMYGSKRSSREYMSFRGYGIGYLNYLWFKSASFNADFYLGDSEYIDKDYKMYDFLKMIYTDAEHTLRTAKSVDFDKILAKTVPSFYTYGDNGRYVYIIYEDGTMICQYLPEANVSVLN